ncbi:unnamed protein product [Lampetra planeri]
MAFLPVRPHDAVAHPDQGSVLHLETSPFGQGKIEDGVKWHRIAHHFREGPPQLTLQGEGPNCLEAACSAQNQKGKRILRVAASVTGHRHLRAGRPFLYDTVKEKS